MTFSAVTVCVCVLVELMREVEETDCSYREEKRVKT